MLNIFSDGFYWDFKVSSIMGKQKHRPGEKRKPFSMPKGGSYRALLAMDFASGRMAYRHSKFKKETRNSCFTFFPLEHDLTKWESAFTDGRAKVFVAGDLSEANVAALTDVSYPVPVETMAVTSHPRRVGVSETCVSAKEEG